MPLFYYPLTAFFIHFINLIPPFARKVFTILPILINFAWILEFIFNKTINTQ